MLDAAGLLTAIQSLLDGTGGFPASPAAAGTNWADAYGAYALTGTANGVPLVEGPGARLALASGLASAFSTSPGDPAVVATSVTVALDAYWVAAVFAGQTGPAVPTGSAAFQVALLDVLDGPERSNVEAATVFRDTLHAYTELVSVPFGAGVFFVV